MGRAVELSDYLDGVSGSNPVATAAAAAVWAMVPAALEIAGMVADGPLAGNLAALRVDDIRGDSQKELDVRSDELIIAALRTAPVAAIASEELDACLMLDRVAPVVVATDPLDGSSNIDTNAPIGTIFSILPTAGFEADLPAAFLQRGSAQIAAGFFIYGPQTALVVTFGDGTQLFTLDRRRGVFVLSRPRLEVPPETKEYAINGSNYHHWGAPIRHYVDDCLSGAEGPRGLNYNTRWIASMVAEAYRILIRGGIYLYPSDARRDYGEGRLRLLYEANPVAFLIEQAGGAATDGQTRILDLDVTGLHQRVPLVFGSIKEVECVALYHSFPTHRGARSPLFRHRTLFRA